MMRTRLTCPGLRAKRTQWWACAWPASAAARWAAQSRCSRPAAAQYCPATQTILQHDRALLWHLSSLLGLFGVVKTCHECCSPCQLDKAQPTRIPGFLKCSFLNLMHEQPKQSPVQVPAAYKSCKIYLLEHLPPTCKDSKLLSGQPLPGPLCEELLLELLQAQPARALQNDPHQIVGPPRGNLPLQVVRHPRLRQQLRLLRVSGRHVSICPSFSDVRHCNRSVFQDSRIFMK